MCLNLEGKLQLHLNSESIEAGEEGPRYSIKSLHCQLVVVGVQDRTVTLDKSTFC